MEKHSRKAIIRAGDTLIIKDIERSDPSRFASAMEVLSYWRACHKGPLESAFRFLQASADIVDRRSVVAKRLKRAPSIIAKLERNAERSMKLRTMQDIGGCRAIVSSEKHVTKLVRELKSNYELKIKHDYVKHPKSDGYRSVHLVGGFLNEGEDENRSIEIQVRSSTQHAWATAVEITDLFTGQAIKASAGRKEWKDFFLYASKQFADFEDIPVFHEMEIDKKAKAIFERLQKASLRSRDDEILTNAKLLSRSMENLAIIEAFSGYANSIKVADEQCISNKIDGFVLLEIDVNAHRVRSTILREDDVSDLYAKAEKAALGKAGAVVALVSTDSIGGLREAYPNYFADSTRFAENLAAFNSAYNALWPSGFFRKVFG